MSPQHTRASEIIPDLPQGREFTFKELELGLSGGEIAQLRKENWIKRVKRDGINGSTWELTTQAKNLSRA